MRLTLAIKGLSGCKRVEPAKVCFLARSKNPQPNIHWIDDTLPELQKSLALLQINSNLIFALAGVDAHCRRLSVNALFESSVAL